MEKIKALTSKSRSLTTLVLFWSTLGTTILYVLITYLTTLPFFLKIPYFYNTALWLVITYYFLTLYFCFANYGKGLSAIVKVIFQSMLQAIFFIFFLVFFYIFLIFGTSDYQLNTFDLQQKASSLFNKYSKLVLPDNAKLIQISNSRYGPNSSINIVFKIKDIDIFQHNAFASNKFNKIIMNFPHIGNNIHGESFGNIIPPPLCSGSQEVQVSPFFFRTKRKVTEIENFCGKRHVIYIQLEHHKELGIIMVIFPKEKLVWLNHTGLF